MNIPDADLVLSGSTDKLQALYETYANDSQAFKKTPLLAFQR